MRYSGGWAGKWVGGRWGSHQQHCTSRRCGGCGGLERRGCKRLDTPTACPACPEPCGLYPSSCNDCIVWVLLLPVLQVEHPVTEWISNVNIPACQLAIGMGVPLHRIPDLRRLYGQDPEGREAIDFEGGGRVAPLGHVVAVRITAGGWKVGGCSDAGEWGRLLLVGCIFF